MHAPFQRPATSTRIPRSAKLQLLNCHAVNHVLTLRLLTPDGRTEAKENNMFNVTNLFILDGLMARWMPGRVARHGSRALLSSPSSRLPSRRVAETTTMVTTTGAAVRDAATLGPRR